VTAWALAQGGEVLAIQMLLTIGSVGGSHCEYAMNAPSGEYTGAMFGDLPAQSGPELNGWMCEPFGCITHGSE
jgi:hypothetical protein